MYSLSQSIIMSIWSASIHCTTGGAKVSSLLTRKKQTDKNLRRAKFERCFRSFNPVLCKFYAVDRKNRNKRSLVSNPGGMFSVDLFHIVLWSMVYCSAAFVFLHVQFRCEPRRYGFELLVLIRQKRFVNSMECGAYVCMYIALTSISGS